MVRRTDHDAVQAERLVVIQQLSPVRVRFPHREIWPGRTPDAPHPRRHNATTTFLREQRIEVRLAASPGADERQVELVAGRIRAQRP